MGARNQRLTIAQWIMTIILIVMAVTLLSSLFRKNLLLYLPGLGVEVSEPESAPSNTQVQSQSIANSPGALQAARDINYTEVNQTISPKILEMLVQIDRRQDEGEQRDQEILEALRRLQTGDDLREGASHSPQGLDDTSSLPKKLIAGLDRQYPLGWSLVFATGNTLVGDLSRMPRDILRGWPTITLEPDGVVVQVDAAFSGLELKGVRTHIKRGNAQGIFRGSMPDGSVAVLEYKSLDQREDGAIGVLGFRQLPPN